MCNFDLETDYYSPRLSLIYRTVSNTSQLLTVILFPPLIYLIVKKSKTLGKYKHYILVHTIISFFFSSFIWMVKPVPMLQKYSLAACGPVADLGSRKLIFSLFILLMSCWGTVSISFSASIFYRAFAVGLYLSFIFTVLAYSLSQEYSRYSLTTLLDICSVLLSL